MQFIDRVAPLRQSPISRWDTSHSPQTPSGLLMTNMPNTSDTQRYLYGILSGITIAGTQVDVLQFKAVEFLESRIRQSIAPKELIRKGHGRLSVFVERVNDEHADFQLLSEAIISRLKTLKLIHSTRYPLFLSEMMEKANLPSQSAQLNPEETLDTDPTVIKKALSSFTNDYVEYLKGLGLELIHREERLPKDTSSKVLTTFYEVTKEISIYTDIVYMHKTVETTSIFVQLGIHGLHACVNVFCFDGTTSGEESEPDRSVILRECDRIKDCIHLYSCILFIASAHTPRFV